jgi:hypothetical protein
VFDIVWTPNATFSWSTSPINIPNNNYSVIYINHCCLESF